MFSKRRVRLAVFSAVVVVGGLFAYVAPAYNVERAPLDDRPGIAYDATISPWRENLSEGAVDSAAIEADLDGNASALFASDQCGLPACAYRYENR
jgi:hypothetical protein